MEEEDYISQMKTAFTMVILKKTILQEEESFSIVIIKTSTWEKCKKANIMVKAYTIEWKVKCGNSTNIRREGYIRISKMEKASLKV